MKLNATIGGRSCTVYRDDEAKILLLQPVDAHDQRLLDSEVVEIGSLLSAPFSLVAFEVKDWQEELTPWAAPPPFGKKPFGDGAADTLDYVENRLLPYVADCQGEMKVVLGGYSLAGLFALWAGYNSILFDGIAAASPSVWYPQWLEYIKGRPMHALAVYLSLGDREAHTKNPVMVQVENTIRYQHELIMTQEIETILEWTQGNHFVNSEKRMAKAFAWVSSVGLEKNRMANIKRI